jgi:hypothetical protein
MARVAALHEVLPVIPKPEKRRRDPAFMAWVKLTQRCMWRHVSRCDGGDLVICDADHAGRRGVGRKSNDDETVPACSLHHRQMTDRSGPVRTMSADAIRAARDAEIDRVQRAFRAAHGPDAIPF